MTKAASWVCFFLLSYQTWFDSVSFHNADRTCGRGGQDASVGIDMCMWELGGHLRQVGMGWACMGDWQGCGRWKVTDIVILTNSRLKGDDMVSTYLGEGEWWCGVGRGTHIKFITRNYWTLVPNITFSCSIVSCLAHLFFRAGLNKEGKVEFT